MIQCKIIADSSFSEVEKMVNRFLQINKIEKIVQIVNLSDEQYVAMAIYYEVKTVK
ncbi:hypothetical protein [Phocaeicola coprocola]|uniref:hypothetical protein n=1 Tax=Phocaeicola coprocola TaxID=310298 RepID=UPI003FD6E685